MHRSGFITYLMRIPAIVSVMIAVLCFSGTVRAATGINDQIHFQGKVVNADGTNVPDGAYDFVFAIYTAASGTSAIWTESRTGGDQVAVTDGIFSLDLGSVTALPGSVDFNTDNIYLGIDFDGDGEMTPRVRFTAAPYAMNAGKVAGLTVTDTTGTLTVPNAKTISFADAFTTTGSNPLTFNTTGTTNVTLPVAGTLLTSSATAGQTVTSTQTSGTVFGIVDSTGITGAVTGLSISLSGSGTQDQTGLSFGLSGATGSNINDILGTSSNWKISASGVGQFASLGVGTDPARLLDVNGALRVRTASTPGTPVSGDIYNSGSSLYYYNGTTWQDLGASGTPGSTNGSVQFNNSGAFGGDAANFFWDNTNKRLGIGTNAPAQALSLNGQALFMPQGGVSTKGYRAYSGRIGSPSVDDRLIFINDSGTDARYWFDSQSATSGFSVANGGLEQAYFGTVGGAFAYVIYQNQPFRIDMGTTGNTAWTITQQGEVGLGTTTPLGRLHAYVPNTAVTTSRYDGYFENLATNTTTNAINKYGLYVTSTGTFTGAAATDTNNYGLYVNTATGADFNYSAAYAGSSGAHAAFLKDLSAAFGSYSETGAHVDRNSYIGEEWSRERGDVAADTAFAWGDGQAWTTDEQANNANDCVFSTVDDLTNGVGRMATGDNNTTCNAYHASGTVGNLHLQFDADNLPVILMKVRPNTVDANNDLWVGLQDQTNLTTNADPTNGIFFGNNNGTTWTGFTRSAGTSTTVACTGQTVSTTQFALLKAEVISTAQVRFYVDNDVSNGVNWFYCGESTANIPTASLGSMLKFQSATAGNSLDIDFFRVWQDDDSKKVRAAASVKESELFMNGGVMNFGALLDDSDDADSLRIANISDIDAAQALAKLMTIPVALWNTNDGGVMARHIAPDPDAFFTQFGLGREGMVDAADMAGVALLAGKGLAVGLESQRLEIARLSAEVERLGARISASDTPLSLPGVLESNVDLAARSGLTVDGPFLVRGEALFEEVATFLGKTTYKNTVSFEKAPKWSRDTAGYVRVAKGDDRIFVKFREEYDQSPVVNITRVLEGALDDEAKDGKDWIFGSKYAYSVAQVRKDGFTILLGKPAKESTLFSWNAFFVPDMKVQDGSDVSEATETDEKKDVPADESVSPDADGETGGATIPSVDIEPVDEAVGIENVDSATGDERALTASGE